MCSQGAAIGVDVHWEIKSGLSVPDAEDIVTALGDSESLSEDVVIDFAKCKHVDAGAGFRLGNSLARFRDSPRSRLIAQIPPIDPARGFSGVPWFSVFLRSGLGLCLARYSTKIGSDSRDVTAEFTSYFERIFEENIQSSKNSVVIRQLLGAHVNLSSEASFLEAHLRAALEKCNFDKDVVAEEDIYSVSTLCYEAVKNVVDHASKPPAGKHLDVLSYLAIRYFKVVSSNIRATGDFSGYLARIHSEGSQRTASLAFLEITVNDDGTGIPARQSQDAEIFRKDFHVELAALHEALTSGYSVKNLLGDQDPLGPNGFGYTFIKDALTQLRAFAVLRTGRCALVLDSTSSTSKDFVLEGNPLGHLPGTALHVVIPIRRSQRGQQLELPLGD